MIIMINQSIEKAFSIIIENQRNADTKSNIFIILLSGFLAFIGKIPISVMSAENQEAFEKFYVIMLIPLILFVLSLIPIFNYKFKFSIKRKAKLDLNIFYWRSIIQFSDADAFINNFQKGYNIDNLSRSELDLLKQIYTNSMILEYKFSTQKFALLIIIQIVILLFSSAISYLSFHSSLYAAFSIFILFEIVLLFNKQIIIFSNIVFGKAKSLLLKIKQPKKNIK